MPGCGDGKGAAGGKGASEDETSRLLEGESGGVNSRACVRSLADLEEELGGRWLLISGGRICAMRDSVARVVGSELSMRRDSSSSRGS